MNLDHFKALLLKHILDLQVESHLPWAGAHNTALQMAARDISRMDFHKALLEGMAPETAIELEELAWSESQSLFGGEHDSRSRERRVLDLILRLRTSK
jgi:hypothetical protein